VALSSVIRLIEENLGKKAIQHFEPVHPADPVLTFADIGKAKLLLGYEPRVTIEEAIARYVEWFKCSPRTEQRSE
jgi:nucleoside-diphosphate-sugar epimerase